MTCSKRWAVAVAAACSGLLAGCSGGGAEQLPSAVCTHAPVPGSGPGDPEHYFPVDVGRTWTYEETESTGPFAPPVLIGTLTVTVGTPTTIQGEPVSVLDNRWSAGADRRSGTDAYAVRSAGVYLVASTDADPPLDQVLPSLILPFSPELAHTTLVACQHLRFAVEGETWDTDLVEWISDVRTEAEMTVPAGTFRNVEVVTQQVDLTMRGRGGALSGHIEVSDAYAPGVGLIREVSDVTAGCYGCTVSLDVQYLTTHAPPSSLGATAGVGSREAAAERSTPSAAMEAPALRGARRIARAYR